jgi:hypothetical protein
MKSQNEISIRKTTKGWLVVAPLVYRLFTDYEAMMTSYRVGWQKRKSNLKGENK